MNNVIQPFIFEKPIDIPKANVSLTKLNRIYNTDPIYQSKLNHSHDPKVSINYNDKNIYHSTSKEDSNVNINIDTHDKERPLGLKLDLFLVDLEIYPKVPKIIKFIGDLF